MIPGMSRPVAYGTRSGLLGCPFCRELFSEGEAELCPECDVPLQPLETLPASYETKVEQEAEALAVPPEHQVLAWTSVRHGRGWMLAIAIAGLAFFFAPWIQMLKPVDVVLTGFDLARQRAGWFWGGAVGWFIMLPLLVTRRSVHQLRGVRIITAAFAALTLVEIVMLFIAPPHATHVPIEFRWGWGLQASLVASTLGILVATRLGGRLERAPVRPEPAAETSNGRILH